MSDQPSTNDVSFDVTAPIRAEVPILEDDMEDAIRDDTLLEDTAVTYDIVDGGTRQRQRRLVSSDGYAYTVKVCIILLSISKRTYVNYKCLLKFVKIK